MSFWAVMVASSLMCSSEQCPGWGPAWEMLAIYALGCPVRGGPIRLYRDSLVAPGSTRAALEPVQMPDGVDGLDPLGVAYAHRALASGVSDGGGAVVGDAFIVPAGDGPALPG